MKFSILRPMKRVRLDIYQILMSFASGFLLASWILLKDSIDADREAFCESSWLRKGISKLFEPFAFDKDPYSLENASLIRLSESVGPTPPSSASEQPDYQYWKTFRLVRDIYQLETSSVKNPRLLCWIMTDPNIQWKARYAQHTWLSKCDIPLIFSSKEDNEFPTIGLKVAAGRKSIAAKSHLAWEHVHKYYADKADFFMKSDPDSFVFVNNLKRFLANRSPSHPGLFGHAMFMDLSNHTFYKRFKGFYAAGEGIVISRKALDNLVKVIDFCPLINGTAEDMKSCICLSMTGVRLTDTRDFKNRETFFPPISLSSIAISQFPLWYTTKYRSYLGYCSNLTCLSAHPIVTHYVKPSEMYIYEYMSRVIDELTDLANATAASQLNYHFRGSFDLF